MDETRYLIILKGEDRTSDVLSFQPQGAKVNITFNSFRSYSYERQNVFIEGAIKVLDITSQRVFSGLSALNIMAKG